MAFRASKVNCFFAPVAAQKAPQKAQKARKSVSFVQNDLNCVYFPQRHIVIWLCY
jgi:hypothetical protein